jgi:3alpha(or 20beta)-hydroxysteroid dehydrogenase
MNEIQAHRLAGRVALVTGGARGIGEATVRRLLAEGAQVVLGDVLVENGELLAKELGAQASFVKLDVTSESDWTRAVEHCVETFGPPSILVSNAGIMCVKPIEQSTVEDFRRTFEVNAIGAFLGIRAVVPLMRANGGGSIITMSSTAGSIGVEGMTAYCASKAANFTIARCAALEFGRDNIRVNAVNPGGIDTAMSRSEAVATIDTGDLYAGLPLARIGKVDEVAALIAFLASDDATFITGGQHVIDGGMLAGQMMS